MVTSDRLSWIGSMMRLQPSIVLVHFHVLTYGTVIIMRGVGNLAFVNRSSFAWRLPENQPTLFWFLCAQCFRSVSRNLNSNKNRYVAGAARVGKEKEDTIIHWKSVKPWPLYYTIYYARKVSECVNDSQKTICQTTEQISGSTLAVLWVKNQSSKFA